MGFATFSFLVIAGITAEVKKICDLTVKKGGPNKLGAQNKHPHHEISCAIAK